MLLFNVTIIVDELVADEFLAWMSNTHIPELMNGNHFVSYRLLKVVDSPNEGITYSAQFIAENEENITKFRDEQEQLFIASMYNKYPNKLVSFSTLMEFLT